jgi:hypothetical protein
MKSLMWCSRRDALLDELGNAVVQASDVIESHCPTTVSFTPAGRLDDMHERLDGLLQAANIVLPALTKFYDSLNDEQKARFNSIGANQAGRPPQSANANPTAECGANVMGWPSEQIDRVVRPDNAQRMKLEALQSAAAQAADIIGAACPSKSRQRHRRGLKQFAIGCRQCCKALRRSSRRLRTFTMR